MADTLTLARYASLTATEMLAGLATGAWRSIDLVEASAALITALEPVLNAHVYLRLDQARAAARACDTEARAGHRRGRLHGLPIAIKDTYDVPGLRSTRGSRLYADQIADKSSPLSDRVLREGAIMMGKTTMPEFGWKASSTSPLTGVTRNPWDTSKTTGGSSSGSAAAVAARLVPAALGGDGGGSIRIPAAFCGVFGLKPSFGRIAVWPGSVHEQLVHHGFLTRTAQDTALLLDVGRGPDPRDPWSLPDDPVSYLASVSEPLDRLRIGFVPRPWGVEIDSDIAAVIDRIVGRLAGTPGWHVSDAVLPEDLPKACFEVLWGVSRNFTSGPTLDDDEDMLDPALVRSVRQAEKFSLKDYLRAVIERRRFAGALQSVFDDFDILVMPTVPVKPFAAEADMPAEWPEDGVLPWIDWSPCTYPFNLAGNPAASVPVGFTPDGLPVGLQVVGPRFADAAVLRAANAIEHCGEIPQEMPELVSRLLV